MTEQATTEIGRSPYDILQDGAGGLHTRAFGLEDLANGLDWAREEFAHDDGSDLAAELSRRAAELYEFIDRLCLTPDAALTLVAECTACGGKGSYGDVDPCDECNGSGARIDTTETTT